MSGRPRPDDLLRNDFQIPDNLREFYRVGRVFHHIHCEANDRHDEANELRSTSVTSSGARAWTKNGFGQWIHSKARRFVIVKSDKFSCLAIPITTYNGQGVAKPGVKKSDHAIIYTGERAPHPMQTELPTRGNLDRLLLDPIKVQPDDPRTALDPCSRLNMAKPQTIEYNARVKSFGMVHKDSLRHLTNQFESVLFPQRHQAIPAVRDMKAYNTARTWLENHGWTEEYTAAVLALIRYDIENGA